MAIHDRKELSLIQLRPRYKNTSSNSLLPSLIYTFIFHFFFFLFLNLFTIVKKRCVRPQRTCALRPRQGGATGESFGRTRSWHSGIFLTLGGCKWNHFHIGAAIIEHIGRFEIQALLPLRSIMSL